MRLTPQTNQAQRRTKTIIHNQYHVQVQSIIVFNKSSVDCGARAEKSDRLDEFLKVFENMSWL